MSQIDYWYCPGCDYRETDACIQQLKVTDIPCPRCYAETGYMLSDYMPKVAKPPKTPQETVSASPPGTDIR